MLKTYQTSFAKSPVFQMTQGPVKAPAGGVVGFTNTKSFLFDGIDEFISVPAAVTNLLDGASAASFSVWFKQAGDGIARTIIFLSTIPAGQAKYQLWFNNNDFLRLSARAASGDSVEELNGVTDFGGDTDWHHLVGVVDLANDLLTLYLDGSVESSASVTFSQTTFDTSSNVANIGKRVSDRFFNGNIEEPALYDTALTAPQVTALYNAGVPSEPDATGLQLWYRMGDDPLDDGTGTTGNIQDQVSTNNGTPINTEAGDIVTDVP